MSILNIQKLEVGVTGVSPAIVFISTNDTEAATLVAGYLNHAQANGAALTQSTMALVSTKTSPNAATTQVGWYEVAYDSTLLNWSLVPGAQPGSVTLPTIANHIATFTNTTGNLSEDAATAINAGNIQAGLSGTAGYLASFPSAGSKGSLRLTGVANTGDTLVTISNAAHGQASVYSIPDSGAATANIIVSALSGTQNITAGSLAVTAGNLQAGSSGHAGTLSSFPATGSKGHLAVVGVANSGDTVTTISNAAMGQASVVSIPDPANAVGQFMIGAGATPFVSGNFPVNSGTAGLMVDSGFTAASVSGAITQLGKLYQVSINLNAAAMANAYVTPQTIIANPAASQMILVVQASVTTNSTGQTPFATGTAPIIQYSSGGTNGQHGAGTIATAAGLVAGDITAATSQVRNLFPIATAAITGLSGLGIYFSNATGAYTAGTGSSITITIVYQLLTATV